MTVRAIACLTIAVALATAGCNREPSGGSHSDAPQNLVLADPGLVSAALTPEEAERLRARVVAALGAILPGAAAAAYADIRPGTGGAICGVVDPSGGATPEAARRFIVMANGTPLISASSELRLDDPNDSFPDLYMQYCASTEELRRLGAQMEGLTSRDVTANPSLPDEPLPIGEPLEEPSEPGEDAQAPRRGNDESFFNSVMRSPPGSRRPD